MNKSVLIIVILSLMVTGLWMSCGNKTRDNETIVDKHSETYIRQRIDTIYNQVYHRQMYLDSAFCSQRYYALLQQTLQLNEETGFVCLDYDHWIMGQDCSPEWTYNAKKIEILTDSTATVEMDIRNFGKHNTMTLELKFERNDWFVDNFVSYSGDEAGERKEYSEVKEMRKFINDLMEVREKGRVFTGYWGWVYEDAPKLLLRLVMTDKGLKCTECTIYRLHSYHSVNTSFDGDYLYLDDTTDENGQIRLKLKLDDIGDLTGECYIKHRYSKLPYEGNITLRKDFFYYRDIPQRKQFSDYAV